MESKINSLLRRRAIKFGVPFVLMVMGGSFFLKQFAQLRYQFSNKSAVKREDFEKYGIKIKKRDEVTLESEYEKIKTLDIDNWEQVRGPRPWEEQSN